MAVVRDGLDSGEGVAHVVVSLAAPSLRFFTASPLLFGHLGAPLECQMAEDYCFQDESVSLTVPYPAAVSLDSVRTHFNIALIRGICEL
jgi:hypothetical protein